MKQITDKEFEKVVLNNEKVVLVDVFATWCGPCRMLGPVLESLQNETSDWLDIVKVDVDEADEIVNNLGVSGVPALFVYKNGAMVENFVGYRTLDQIKEIVEAYK